MNMKKKTGLWVIIFTALAFLNCYQDDNKRYGINGDFGNTAVRKDTIDAVQLIIITTNGWNEVKGTMRCYEKKGHLWNLIFSNPVVVGINGMGVGFGIMSFDLENTPLKKEGDLRAPAGIFKIGTAFGYAVKNDVFWLKVPYLEATNSLLCIDDGNSSHYNKFVYSDNTRKDWNSHEEMHRKDNMYKWGLLVEHNYASPETGKGSCIFLHIWKSYSKGTAGCSAMQESDILKLLKWVDSAKKPLLIQFPKKEYDYVAKKINLPVF